jgi:uncharacterized protein YdhG (YjbR/CyaY superfamily)
MNSLNTEVTKLVNIKKHKLSDLILILRLLILSSDKLIEENIKWNSPNYSVNEQDRVTLRIYPVDKVQIVFHRGSQVKTKPKFKLMDDPKKLLIWKENDRAVMMIDGNFDFLKNELYIKSLVKNWISKDKYIVPKLRIKSKSKSKIKPISQKYKKDISDKIIQIVFNLAPDSKKVINYGIPTFKLNGVNLVHFALYDKHLGFYPTPSAVEFFKKELSQYKYSKGSIQFPLDKKIPFNLIKKITGFRIKEIKSK